MLRTIFWNTAVFKTHKLYQKTFLFKDAICKNVRETSLRNKLNVSQNVKRVLHHYKDIYVL